MRVTRTRFRGIVERHSEAVQLLEKPGDIALVVRGVPRMLVFACPDGCGDIVPVNLDPRADKAWHYYRRDDGDSLYPSVWREEGCQSHFILWNDAIYWNGIGNKTTSPLALRKAVLTALVSENFKSYFEIALELDEIPWAVGVTCSTLVQEGIAEEAAGKGKGRFRLVE